LDEERARKVSEDRLLTSVGLESKTFNPVSAPLKTEPIVYKKPSGLKVVDRSYMPPPERRLENPMIVYPAPPTVKTAQNVQQIPIQQPKFPLPIAP
jgi:hypothetical protein